MKNFLAAEVYGLPNLDRNVQPNYSIAYTLPAETSYNRSICKSKKEIAIIQSIPQVITPTVNGFGTAMNYMKKHMNIWKI